MKYYPIVKNWRKIKKHLNNKQLNDILVFEFNKYTYGCWEIEFKHGEFPSKYETCMWDLGIIGRRPTYFRYVKHGACHWLVNFNLKLASLVEPKKQWRVVTSDAHSTVWDGEKTLFDMNYSALGVDPDDAFERANKEQLKVNEFMPIGLAPRRIPAK